MSSPLRLFAPSPRNRQRFLLAVVAMLVTAPAQPGPLVEPPILAERVAQGALPPIEERLPASPRVLPLDGPGLSPGKHGGDLRLLMGRSKDTRLMVVYGYSRLLGYSPDLVLLPDILEDVMVEEGRRFTFRLRAGHRWSDGHPFTSEDFRYWWENIASDRDLAPFGPPAMMIVDGEKPTFAQIDDVTVRYEWPTPNPFFLPALAGARPETIFAPAHYLKQFHAGFGDRAELEALIKEEGRRNWAAVHISRFRPYKNINPDLPTLEPWVLATRPPAQRFVFERNPYFHRVDTAGRQLPYLDRVLMTIAGGKLIPAKTGAGESDLQARHLSFSDYTFLKESESRTRNRVLLWRTTKGSHIAIFPNLNARDPVWRKLMRDERFRHALSLGIDRTEINQVIYYGLAVEGNDTVFETSPLHRPELRTRWAGFGLDKANALLDELGLDRRRGDGLRLLPDGRPMEVIVETAGEDTEQVDVLELVGSTWEKLGIKLFSKPSQREVFRNRIYSGDALLSVWGGIENGLPTADSSPFELAPTRQDQLQWPMWGQHLETGGNAGEAPDMAEAIELAALNAEWITTAEASRREAIWERMLEIRAEKTFTIGIVAGVPQPVVIHRSLRNVPEKGVYNWDPGAHFGMYRLDTFWFDR